MKPICVPCQRFYRCKRNGFYFIEGMPQGPEWDGKSGKDSSGWVPYKIFLGDLYECPSCGHQTIRPNEKPMAEHYEPVFADYIQKLNITFMVKDC